MIGSATHIYNARSPEFVSQQIWFAIGFVLLIAFSLIDIESICKFYLVIYLLNLCLLTVVLFMGNGSVTRWISIGPFGLQPSEFAKIFMIVFLASIIDSRISKVNRLSFLCFVIISAAIPIALIMKQPSLSASTVIIAITFAILFTAGLDYKYIRNTLFAILPISLLFYFDLIREKHIIIHKLLKDYQIQRILALMNSDPHSQTFYQTNQSIFAIGSGKLIGKGLYNGTINRLHYLPESHNDFIFAVIGEEFGFVGTIFILALFIALCCVAISIAHNAKSSVNRLIAIGIASMFTFQAFVNIGVATGILPNTGMPLPFISYGGSSMLVNMIATGMLINISRNSNPNIFS